MTKGWDASAAAGIADVGDVGDFGRRYVLDPVMLARALEPRPQAVLDVGSGRAARTAKSCTTASTITSPRAPPGSTIAASGSSTTTAR